MPGTGSRKTAGALPALLLSLLFSLTATASRAGNLDILVQDSGGKPLPDAVVYVLPPAGANLPVPARHDVMDQLDKAFKPHVLAVQTGTTVDFPNSDSINHHVYSFSPAKTFQLRLFRNEPRRQSVTFDRAGSIAMGCNIHDWMLGYVFVVDTPWFAVTDAEGQARIAGLPDGGSLSLQLWHPRSNEDPGTGNRIAPGTREVQWRLVRPLKPERRVRQTSYD